MKKYFNCLSKHKDLLRIIIYSLLLLIIIFLISKICIKYIKQNKDTIIFYIANWCPHSQRLIPFINECKKQKQINIVIVNVDEMNNKEKKIINSFPTAIRYSDNKKAIGEVDIKKLVNDTLLKSNIEYFDSDVSNNINRIGIVNNKFYDVSTNNLIKNKKNSNTTRKNNFMFGSLSNNNKNSNTTLQRENKMKNSSTHKAYFEKRDRENFVTDISNNQIIFYLNNNSKSKMIRSIIDKNKNKSSYKLIINNPTNINHSPSAVIQSNNRTYNGYNDVLSLLEEIFNIKIFEDTIKFYVAEWCEHCKSLEGYINQLKNREQNKVKITVVDYNNMSNNENTLITGFPAIMRESDKLISFGSLEIEKLVNNTFSSLNEKFTTNNDSKDTITFYIAEWCGHSQRLIPYIEEYKTQQNKVNVEVIYDKDTPKYLNITGYPTAIRKSDNKRAVGGPDILNLMKESVENENEENENTIIVFLADWCSHCQHFKPQLDEIKKTNNNIKIVESKDITQDLQQYIQGFPTALKLSDKSIAVGAPNILKMINNSNTKVNNKKYIFVYSDDCKYSNMLLPIWLDFKLYVKDNNLDIHISEYESKNLEELEEYYKNQLDGFPTLFINDNEKYNGYNEIKKYLKNL